MSNPGSPVQRVLCADRDAPKLDIDQQVFDVDFDRRPIGYAHNLNRLDIFKFDALQDLAHRYDQHRHDVFIASGAKEPGQIFYDVRTLSDLPSLAMQSLDVRPCRILLKRPEHYSPAFSDLLNVLFEQITRLRGGRLSLSQVVRLESAILISSSHTTTPFHFDPEVGFFCQIEGSKEYHVYEPSVVVERELEDFYRGGIVDIGQIELVNRNVEKEHVFNLVAGRGFHQPQNAPHWVETGTARSISYTMVFETERSRAQGRVRAFNHYQRKLGVMPTPPGHRPGLDSAKSQTMTLALPLRRFVGRNVRAALLR